MEKQLPRISEVDTRTSHSVNLIIDLIRNGHFKSGVQLPPQDELAKNLGISRTSLREALAELSYRGVVESVHGRGTFVREQEAHAGDIMETRRILEPKVAALAAERAAPQEIIKLKTIYRAMEQFVADGDTVAFSDFDLRFHSQLAAMTHNKALITLFNSISDMLLHLQNIVQIIPGAMANAHGYHRKIIDAVANGDGIRAENVMRKHLEDVDESLKKGAAAPK